MDPKSAQNLSNRGPKLVLEGHPLKKQKLSNPYTICFVSSTPMLAPKPYLLNYWVSDWSWSLTKNTAKRHNFYTPSLRQKAQDGPWIDPKMVPKCSKRLPRSSQEPPRSPQEPSRSPQIAPRASKIAPRAPKIAPGTPQDRSKGPPRSPKEIPQVHPNLPKSLNFKALKPCA